MSPDDRLLYLHDFDYEPPEPHPAPSVCRIGRHQWAYPVWTDHDGSAVHGRTCGRCGKTQVELYDKMFNHRHWKSL